MDKMEYNILNQVSLNSDPVQNVIVDDFFEKDYLEKLLEFFPSEHFNNDLRGNFSFFPNESINALPKIKKEFWHCFFNDHLPIITKKLALKFEHLVDKKFNKLVKLKKDFIYGSIMLSQNKGDGLDFCPHYHFNNDPLWFMTVLIYLDGEQNSAPGTTFYSLNQNNYTDNFFKKYIRFNELRNDKSLTYAEQTKMINEHLSDFKKTNVPFKNNRLFCFLDTFTSIHSVEYTKIKNVTKGTRKSIRFHVGFDRNMCDEVYGMSIGDFNAKMNTPINQDVEKIFKTEIDFFKNEIVKSTFSKFKSTFSKFNSPKFNKLNVQKLEW